MTSSDLKASIKPASRSQTTPPADLLEAPPVKPQLSVLTFGPEKPNGSPDVGLNIPDAQLQKWANHPQLGDRFHKFLDSHVEEFGRIAAAVSEENAQGANADPEPEGGEGTTATHVVGLVYE